MQSDTKTHQYSADGEAPVIMSNADLVQYIIEQAAFIAQKDSPDGIKTMKAYLWSLELASYDAQQG